MGSFLNIIQDRKFSQTKQALGTLARQTRMNQVQLEHHSWNHFAAGWHPLKLLSLSCSVSHDPANSVWSVGSLWRRGSHPGYYNLASTPDLLTLTDNTGDSNPLLAQHHLFLVFFFFFARNGDGVLEDGLAEDWGKTIDPPSKHGVSALLIALLSQSGVWFMCSHVSVSLFPWVSLCVRVAQPSARTCLCLLQLCVGASAVSPVWCKWGLTLLKALTFSNPESLMGMLSGRRGILQNAALFSIRWIPSSMKHTEGHTFANACLCFSKYVK